MAGPVNTRESHGLRSGGFLPYGASLRRRRVAAVRWSVPSSARRRFFVGFQHTGRADAVFEALVVPYRQFHEEDRS
ncbi:MAG: hypothetical protein AMXMBFR7_01250 [Planctomycetota bacterium]